MNVIKQSKKEALVPNINFIGYSVEDYRKYKNRIDAVLQKMELGEDAVTTFLPGSLVESCDGKRTSMPYLKIFNSNPEQTEKIVVNMAVSGLFFDIEKSSGGFISEAEMREINKNCTGS